jgi:hypothetical protein
MVSLSVASTTVSISWTRPWLCRTYVHTRIDTFLRLQATLHVTHSHTHLCPIWWTWQELCQHHRLETSLWWLATLAHSRPYGCSRCSQWQSTYTWGEQYIKDSLGKE